MIHVKIDIVPFGEEDGRKMIGDLYIWNMGSVDGSLGSICKYGTSHTDPRISKENVKYIKHTRSDGAFVLTQKALKVLNKKCS